MAKKKKINRQKAKKPQKPNSGNWKQNPFIRMQNASELMGLSRASLYRLGKQNKIILRRIAGRTLIVTRSLLALINENEKWISSSRAKKAATISRRNLKQRWVE